MNAVAIIKIMVRAIETIRKFLLFKRQNAVMMLTTKVIGVIIIPAPGTQGPAPHPKVK